MLSKNRGSGSALTFALLSCLGGAGALAQEESSTSNAQSNRDAESARHQDLQLEEIVVSGTRIARDGYSAPTPVTIMGEAEINATAPQNVADIVNQLPSVIGSLTPRTTLQTPTFSNMGVNGINLRNLGLGRTLVLLDGRRTVASTVAGVVDINEFPQQLISRVEIVTGGASSAYGSDAVAGVVNFILDHDFTGFKFDVEGGRTRYGDNDTWSAAATGGFDFAGERGHLLLSGELSRKDGVRGMPRDWAKRGVQRIPNPAYAAGNGQPQYIVSPQVAYAGATWGGIITTTASSATPLSGTAFGPGGTPYRFNYGALAPGPTSWMVGGEWRSNQFFSSAGLDSDEERENVFLRASYELFDDVEVFVQSSYGHTITYSPEVPQFSFGNITVSQGNPYIPATVAAQMAAQNISQFVIGSMNGDLPAADTTQERTVTRYLAGAAGAFPFLGGDWKWDVHYERGVSEEDDASFMRNNINFALAVDAVINPATGAVVCRSTLTNPGNGCVPYNPMGIGVNNRAAIDYVTGYSEIDLRFTQDAAAFNLQGEPFSTWAGPVSVATGFEYRKEKVSGTGNPVANLNGWLGANYRPTFGSINVKEAYFETVVPLLTDVAFAKSLELNGAVRRTDYSTSGLVTTWKGGVTYSPVRDLRFRGTRSRDIRAPNLGELYTAVTGTIGVINPFNNNQSVTISNTRGGNPLLKPEFADTLGVGVVYQPSWLSGFSTSVDYYEISIDNAIGTLPDQTVIDRCFQGAQTFCSVITFNGNNITHLFSGGLNLNSQEARGLDIEFGYTREALGGALSFRGLATHFIENSTLDQAGRRDTAGTAGLDWRFRGTLSYARDPYTITLVGRGFTDSRIDNSFIECATSCPTSTVANPTINDNHIPGVFYIDASFAYKLSMGGAASGDAEAFFAVQNLLDKDPALYGYNGPGATSAIFRPVDPSLFDILGRTYRAGLRMKF